MMIFIASNSFYAVLFLVALTATTAVYAQNADYQKHYLVGLLNYPNSFIPDEFKDHTSGTYIETGTDMWVSSMDVPFNDIPGVGFSDMEFYYDEDGQKVIGEYYCLSDNGYGTSDNSADYPLNIQHLKIQKPFTYRHGESTFDPYTVVDNLGTALIHDPNKYIKWENNADIQVEYNIPDETWNDYKELRVLTGRDFDLEGLAVISQECAIVGDELMPAVFMINPMTGVVLSPFVRTPDIDISTGKLLKDKFLSTVRDKVHCTIDALEKNECSSVDSVMVDESDYRKHDPSGGYEGFSLLDDGTIAAFIEKNSGDTTLQDEPGIRVYKIRPGDCNTPGVDAVPVFESFMGFYPFEINGGAIADVSSIPGSSRFVAVIERNGFPNGHMFPAPVMPANNLCIVDLEDVDKETMVFQNKKCILNYHDIDDPWDTDGNGILKYAQTQVTNEALIIVDDYCMVAGTDTNFPWTNQFELNEESDNVQYFQEVSDARFMVVCFVEPIFNTMGHNFYKDNFAASSPSVDDTDMDANGNEDETEEDDNSDASDCQSIDVIVCSTPEFSMLCELISSSSMELPSTWTVFAPTDTAFDEYMSIEDVSSPEALTELLLFHTVYDNILYLEDLPCIAGDNLVTMANGEEARIICKAGIPTMVLGRRNDRNNNPPNIVDGNIEACNGVIHVIDHILK